MVMHPDDKTEVDIAKGSDEHYLWLESQFGPTNRLLRLPVVETTAIVAGTAAVGAFAMALQGYDVWDAFVEIAEQHSDYRRRNLVLVVGEERLMLANYRPQAIIEVTFDGAPTV
jgi:HK97 family phage major capsid protein